MAVEAMALIEALRDLDLKPRSYSGRGMYGKQCVSVNVERGGEYAVGVGLGRALGDAAADLHPSGDAMGLGSVMYWPAVAWPEGLRDFDEEDGD